MVGSWLEYQVANFCKIDILAGARKRIHCVFKYNQILEKNIIRKEINEQKSHIHLLPEIMNLNKLPDRKRGHWNAFTGFGMAFCLILYVTTSIFLFQEKLTTELNIHEDLTTF